MTCPDLCTAEKCRELEQRISFLEQRIGFLENAFRVHVSEPIPQAHEYTPYVQVDLTTSGNTLFAFVAVDDFYGFDSVELPTYEPFVTFDIFDTGDGSYVFKVQVDGDSDEDTLTLPIHESNLRLDGSFQSDTLTLTVADGTSQDTAQISIPIPEIPEPPEPLETNLRGSASFRGDTLTVSIADGISSDTFQVNIPTNTGNETIFITEEIYMNCDELERKIDDCCQQILNAIDYSQSIIVSEIEDSESNLTNQIDAAQNVITGDIQTVENYVTVDISGTVKSNFNCDFATDENQNIVPGYAEATTEDTGYQGVGLTGLHESLKLIHTNLEVIYQDVCKAIEPISSLSVNDLYQFCRSSVTVDRSLYFDELDNARYTGASEDYDAAVDAALSALLAETKYAYLIDNAIDGKLIEAPSSWITPILADFSLIQSRINNTAICDIEIPDDPEVVSIVASDRFTTRASGKFLVLHFVTPDNYPKRSRNSTYWQTQIPAAKEESFYDWCRDFENLRWSRGNCYAELKFNQFSNPVSGFFLDKAAADSYFDNVLTLTTATEKNRVYHEHKTPGTSVIERVTRPYRAFIESVNDAGQVICHVKYVPAIDPPCQ